MYRSGQAAQKYFMKDEFKFSEDEIRSGAQAGCAFFKLCIKKLERDRELAFCSASRRLIGRLSPG